ITFQITTSSSFIKLYYHGLLENLVALKREPKGFGFVQFLEPADAAQAKYHMDGQVLLTVVFAEENRKKPSDMQTR
ncbi:serine/arginine-rich SC35-like splicing factor SCL33 isoform X2, partial [Tanacetum coccineum]